MYPAFLHYNMITNTAVVSFLFFAMGIEIQDILSGSQEYTYDDQRKPNPPGNPPSKWKVNVCPPWPKLWPWPPWPIMGSSKSSPLSYFVLLSSSPSTCTNTSHSWSVSIQIPLVHVCVSMWRRLKWLTIGTKCTISPKLSIKRSTRTPSCPP